MVRNSAVGRYGEDVACRFLQSNGITVVARNWRCPHGEVDIVAVDGSTLVVCEVKTRTGDRCGSPAEAVTPEKVRRLRRLAAIWLQQARSAGSDTHYSGLRVDVVAVARPVRGAALVDHLRGVE